MKLATKAVTRRVTASVFSAGKYRNVVVTVCPDGILALRLHGQRRTEFMFIDVAYKRSVVERQHFERFLKRKAKGKK